MMMATTWNADVQEISPRRALASVGIKVKENGAQNGQENAPRMGRRVHHFIDNVRLVRHGCRVNQKITAAAARFHLLGQKFLLRVDVAHELAEIFAVGYQK